MLLLREILATALDLHPEHEKQHTNQHKVLGHSNSTIEEESIITERSCTPKLQTTSVFAYRQNHSVCVQYFSRRFITASDRTRSQSAGLAPEQQVYKHREGENQRKQERHVPLQQISLASANYFLKSRVNSLRSELCFMEWWRAL